MPNDKTPHLSIIHTESNTGRGDQVLRVLRESKLLAERGHQLAIACRPDSILSQMAMDNNINVRHFPFPKKGFFGIGLIAALAKFMRQFDADIVNTHSSTDSWAGGIAAKFARVPVIVRTRHIQSSVKPSSANKFLYGKIADKIITTGEKVADTLADELGIVRSHFISIPTGVNTGRFCGQGKRTAVRTGFQIRDNQPAIGIIGVLRGMKNHRLFLEMAKSVREEFPDAVFPVIGGGPLLQSLEAYAAELSISNSVIFAGHRDDMPDVLSALDMVVLSSSRGEGLPQVITQAMAMGKPVVATDVGSVSEVVRNEQTGLLVPPEDCDALSQAVIRLLKDSSLSIKLAAAGRQLVLGKYSETNMADTVEDLFVSLYEKKRKI